MFLKGWGSDEVKMIGLSIKERNIMVRGNSPACALYIARTDGGKNRHLYIIVERNNFHQGIKTSHRNS